MSHRRKKNMKEENVDQKEPEALSEQKNDPVVVSILVPHQNVVNMRWAENFRYLSTPFNYRCYTNSYPLIDIARDVLVRTAMKESNPEWIFFLDSDTLCPSNTITRLIQIAKEQKIDVLSGLVWGKSGAMPGELEEGHVQVPLASMIINKNLSEGSIVYRPIIEEIKQYLDKNAVLEVDSVGAGCLLIKTDVFKKLDESNPNLPYFQWGYGRKDAQGKPLLQVGEDFYFCYRLTSELGLKPYVSTEIRCEHLFFPYACSRRALDGKMIL